MKTAWDVLGISPSASSLEVRRAFAAGVRAVHPDTGADPTAAPDRLAELLEARDIAVKLNGYREAARVETPRPAAARRAPTAPTTAGPTTTASNTTAAPATIATQSVTTAPGSWTNWEAPRPARPSMTRQLARAALRSRRWPMRLRPATR